MAQHAAGNRQEIATKTDTMLSERGQVERNRLSRLEHCRAGKEGR